MQVNEKHYIQHPTFGTRLKSLNALNPVSYYSNRYLKKSARLSQAKIQKIIPALDGKIEFIDIPGRKNVKISAWDINPNNSKNYVIFLHGMAQNVSDYQRLYEAIITKSTGVFALEFRGYGTNPRAFLSEDRLRKDIEKAYEYLTKEKKINPQNIIMMGHSMGGALATNFATKHKDIRSLILICPIYNLQHLGKKFIEHPVIGVGIPPFLRKLTANIKILDWLHALRFSTARKIGKVEAPTYLLQSKNDSVTTIDNARLLAHKARVTGNLKHFSVFPNGGHKVDKQKIDNILDILDEILTP